MQHKHRINKIEVPVLYTLHFNTMCELIYDLHGSKGVDATTATTLKHKVRRHIPPLHGLSGNTNSQTHSTLSHPAII